MLTALIGYEVAAFLQVVFACLFDVVVDGAIIDRQHGVPRGEVSRRAAASAGQTYQDVGEPAQIC